MSANRGDNNVHLIFAIIHDTDKLSLLNPNFFMHLLKRKKKVTIPIVVEEA